MQRWWPPSSTYSKTTSGCSTTSNPISRSTSAISIATLPTGFSDIDNALLDFESRGANFFEETLRLGRIFDLINKAKIKSDFEKNVVGDLPQAVEKRVEAVIDWMVESELEQWKAVMAHLEER